jgi:transposase
MVTVLYLATIEDPDDAQVAARRCVTDYLAAHIADQRTLRLLETQRRQRLALPRRPRARQSHRCRVAARRAAGAQSGNDPGDDGPAEPAPALAPDGILAAIRLGLSNGRLEGLNSKIRLISHRSFGFHSADALIALVYLCCTGIVIELPR